MEDYTEMRMNEIQLYTTWMDQRNILSERSQAQKSVYDRITFTENSKIANTIPWRWKSAY